MTIRHTLLAQPIALGTLSRPHIARHALPLELDLERLPDSAGRAYLEAVDVDTAHLIAVSLLSLEMSAGWMASASDRHVLKVQAETIARELDALLQLLTDSDEDVRRVVWHGVMDVAAHLVGRAHAVVGPVCLEGWATGAAYWAGPRPMRARTVISLLKSLHAPSTAGVKAPEMARPQLRAAITVCAVALQALVDELGGSITDMFWLEIGALERRWAKPVACPVLDFEVCCDSA